MVSKRWMKPAVVVLLALAWVGNGAVLAQPLPPETRAPQAVAAQEVLYEQMDNPGSGILSQEFPNFTMSTAEAADDFTVPGTVSYWVVNTVEVRGSYSADYISYMNFSGVNVTFYLNSSNLPGSTAYPTQLVAPANVANYKANPNNFIITLSTPVTLTRGTTYWVAVQPVMYSPYSWFWQTRKTQSGQASAWRNPAGGWGYPNCRANWGYRKTTCGYAATDNDGIDMQFRLSGTVFRDPELGNVPTTVNFMYSTVDLAYYPGGIQVTPLNVGVPATLVYNATTTGTPWLAVDTSTLPSSGGGYFMITPLLASPPAASTAGTVSVSASSNPPGLVVQGTPKTITVNVTVVNSSIKTIFLPLVNR